MSFINDYHYTFDFGKYNGKRIMDVPVEYLNWVLKNMPNKPICDAIRRINNRRGVTTLIRGVNAKTDGIPEMVEVTASFQPIYRPTDINPALFGSFVEYLIKAYLRLSINEQAHELLAMYGLVECPPHLTMQGPPNTPDQRIKWIYNSYMRTPRSIGDICNLSFSHSILMGHFNEQAASKLFTYVNRSHEYFDSYLRTLQLPTPSDQSTCDKLSVGCVIGVIDMLSDDSIVDIKCCMTDDIEYYRKQLFSYACLHHLRYGSHFARCEVYNFLTGKWFIMALGDSCERLAKPYICQLGGHCPEHVKLFM